MIANVDAKLAKTMTKPPMITNYKYSNDAHLHHHHHHVDILNESRILDSSINLSQHPNKALTRFILNSTAVTNANDSALFKAGPNSGSLILNELSSNDFTTDSTLRLERNYSYVEAMKDETIVGVALPSLIGDSTLQAVNILDALDNGDSEFIGFGKANGLSRQKGPTTYSSQQASAWVDIFIIFQTFCGRILIKTVSSQF